MLAGVPRLVAGLHPEPVRPLPDSISLPHPLLLVLCDLPDLSGTLNLPRDLGD